MTLMRVTYSKFGHVQAETISVRDEQEAYDIFENNGCRVMEVKPAFPPRQYTPTPAEIAEMDADADAREEAAAMRNNP